MSELYELRVLPDGSTVAAPTPELLAQQARRRREKRIADALIPPRVWPYLEDPGSNEAVDAVRKFIELGNRKTFLLLLGSLGLGKTIAACWGAVHADCSALYVKSVDVAAHDMFDEEYRAKLREVSLLVFDDIGSEPLDEKGWMNSKIDAIVDHRYDWLRKTIFTSNLAPDELKARYMTGPGQRTLERIREYGTIVSLNGPSLRKPVGT